MNVSKEKIFEYLKEVADPEIPVINLVELGVVRDIHVENDHLQVDITPTYSGCPAMKMMEQEIVETLNTKGFDNVQVKTVYSPAWTTDWMSEETKRKMNEYGIAPPGKVSREDSNPFQRSERTVACPVCASEDTRLTSEFGSTACKALYHCNNCHQPFEHFKCI